MKVVLTSVAMLVTLSFPADSSEGPAGFVFVDDACGAMGITLEVIAAANRIDALGLLPGKRRAEGLSLRALDFGWQRGDPNALGVVEAT